MRIIKPCENGKLNFSSLTEDYMKNSIFLAGPCSRKNSVELLRTLIIFN